MKKPRRPHDYLLTFDLRNAIHDFVFLTLDTIGLWKMRGDGVTIPLNKERSLARVARSSQPRVISVWLKDYPRDVINFAVWEMCEGKKWIVTFAENQTTGDYLHIRFVQGPEERAIRKIERGITCKQTNAPLRRIAAHIKKRVMRIGTDSLYEGSMRILFNRSDLRGPDQKAAYPKIIKTTVRELRAAGWHAASFTQTGAQGGFIDLGPFTRNEKRKKRTGGAS